LYDQINPQIGKNMMKKCHPGQTVHDTADKDDRQDNSIMGIHKTQKDDVDYHQIKALGEPTKRRKENGLKNDQRNRNNGKENRIHRVKNFKRLSSIYEHQNVFEFIKINTGLDGDILKQL
jgi:hypothetical protein